MLSHSLREAIIGNAWNHERLYCLTHEVHPFATAAILKVEGCYWSQFGIQLTMHTTAAVVSYTTGTSSHGGIDICMCLHLVYIDFAFMDDRRTCARWLYESRRPFTD
jgi:hypothetical protein